MHHLISVIVPVYNVEEFLPKCIESLIAQNYRNIEVLLINDGSKDASGDICDFYASKDNRIKVFHKVNGGLSDARNLGIKFSSGQYISFVDSDDYVDVDFLNQLFISIQDSDMALCSYTSFSDESFTGNINNDLLSIEKINKEEYLRELVDLNNVKLVVAWNKLYKRSLLNDFSFVKGVLHEDEFAIHHIIDKCNTISLINKELYFYRQRPNSITSDKRNEKSFKDKLMAYYDRYLFYKDKSMNNQADVILSQILFRCAMRTVTPDDIIWKELGNYKNIIMAKGVSFTVRLLLLIKVTSYPFYQKIITIYGK